MLWSTLSSLKRPYFTYLYETLLSFGYIFLVLANLVPFLLLVRDPIASTVLVLMIVILASVVYIYLEVTWSLGFIVSVLEEKSGSEAIGKAAKIVKGRRLHGFLLNLVFRILSLVIYVGAMLVNLIKAGTVNPVIIGLFVTIVVSLVDMLRLMTYTILYYQCKKNHGEEVELPWRKGYSKVGSSLPLVNIENNGP
ncbi:hypothetical protein Pint_21026 [Pistacia integerrima]|uniref:Uncharacterized protein n=1 Tax=Pistacia integerrima TaxID=434235 RepID=A0ACC0XE97_9ROSI|nr:hypothetical protein Pint_21026 [Pistacia integerrima]